MITRERRYLQRDCARWASTAPTATRTSSTCPPRREAVAPRVSTAPALRVRNYADGGVRITVGNRASTRAVLAALSA